jgi:hypothetical protein
MLSFLKGEKYVLSHKCSPIFIVQICYVDIFFDNLLGKNLFQTIVLGDLEFIHKKSPR